MGWTAYHSDLYTNGRIDRKAECDYRLEGGLNEGRLKVLKSRMVGSTYYAAVQTLLKKNEQGEYVDIPETDREVFAAIFLTSVDSKVYDNFAYKAMDETEGPCQDDCPLSILELLTPTDHEFALDWRSRCYKRIEDRANRTPLGSLHVGSVVEFEARGKTYRAEKLVKRAWMKNGAMHHSSVWHVVGMSCKVSSQNLNRWGYKIVKATAKEEEQKTLESIRRSMR